jgi:hypothetical protein
MTASTQSSRTDARTRAERQQGSACRAHFGSVTRSTTPPRSARSPKPESFRSRRSQSSKRALAALRRTGRFRSRRRQRRDSFRRRRNVALSRRGCGALADGLGFDDTGTWDVLVHEMVVSRNGVMRGRAVSIRPSLPSSLRTQAATALARRSVFVSRRRKSECSAPFQKRTPRSSLGSVMLLVGKVS